MAASQEEFVAKLLAEVSLPNTYAFKSGQHSQYKLIRTTCRGEETAGYAHFSPQTGTVAFSPQTRPGEIADFFLRAVADNLTFPDAERRKNKNDIRDRKKIKGASHFTLDIDQVEDEFIYKVSQKFKGANKGEESIRPFFTLCCPKKDEAARLALIGAIWDVEETFSNLKKTNYIRPHIGPNADYYRGMQP